MWIVAYVNCNSQKVLDLARKWKDYGYRAAYHKAGKTHLAGEFKLRKII